MAAEAKKDTKIKKDGVAKTREEALELALKGIEKDFGEGAIMRLGDPKARMSVEVIPTGILPIDLALGVGGLPRGKNHRDIRTGVLR